MFAEDLQTNIIAFFLGVILATAITWSIMLTRQQQMELNEQKVSKCLFNIPVYKDYTDGRKSPNVVNLDDVTDCQNLK